MSSEAFFETMVDHWPFWFVSLFCVVAAFIDGWKLKVPNWLDIPDDIWRLGVQRSGLPDVR